MIDAEDNILFDLFPEEEEELKKRKSRNSLSRRELERRLEDLQEEDEDEYISD